MNFIDIFDLMNKISVLIEVILATNSRVLHGIGITLVVQLSHCLRILIVEVKQFKTLLSMEIQTTILISIMNDWFGELPVEIAIAQVQM
jgi:hypothetical protein